MSSFGSDPAKSDRLPQAVWESVAKKKIYFGHMSVGTNILDGIHDLEREGQVQLNIVETSDPAAFEMAIFAHSPIGENARPRTKIDRFRTILESGVGAKADVALFKFCYVDIDGGTDIEALISANGKTIEDLQARYPKLTVAVVTAPLTAVPTGLKARLKKWLGRGEPDKAANAKRTLFNVRLRETYGDRVFDLAALESTRPTGERVTFGTEGRMSEALEPSYTDDGGHLNAAGRTFVAAGLLRFLAGLGARA